MTIQPERDEARDALGEEIAWAQRRIVQLERVAATSSSLATQSKRAMLRAHQELRATIEKLRETTSSLADAKRIAEDASAAKSEFLATMSHEIRTPMNGFLGCLDLFVTSELTEEQLELVELMRSSSGHLLAIINDLLDFSKVESGKLALEETPFSLQDCVQAVASLYRPTAEEKGVELGVWLDPKLPEHVLGDPLRLRQIIVNLVSNAIKFTAAGVVCVRVSSAPRGQVELRVHDTGIGIPKEGLEGIFEAFTQADRGTTRRFGGTGLGLAICKRLVDLMGGDLKVESRTGEGTTFWFRISLPATDLKLDSELSARIPQPIVDGLGLRVLCADDVEINRAVIVRMLRKLGCKTETASDGREAIRMVAASTYDVILMDCSMPVLDGFEATDAIRRMEGNGPRHTIIALTANAMAEDRERCLAAGMDDYLSKPLRLEELRAALRRYLTGRIAA